MAEEQDDIEKEIELLLARSRKKRRSPSPTSSETDEYDGDSDDSDPVHSTDDEIKNRERSLIEEKRDHKRRSLLNMKIPKVWEFASADTTIPDAPALKEKTLRKRIKLDDTSLELFEEAAKGKHMPREEREAFIEAIPLPGSIYALPPAVEDTLVQDKKPRITLTERHLQLLQQTVLSSMSTTAIALSELSKEEKDEQKARGYLRATLSLLGNVNLEFTAARREAVLRAHQVDPYHVVPAFRIEPLANSTVMRYAEPRPSLFGPLLDQVTMKAAKSDVQKSLETLRSKTKHREAPRSRQNPIKDGKGRTFKKENRKSDDGKSSTHKKSKKFKKK